MTTMTTLSINDEEYQTTYETSFVKGAGQKSSVMRREGEYRFLRRVS